MSQKKVAIVMGSDSDLPTVQKAITTLKGLGVPYEAHVLSAHRRSRPVPFPAPQKSRGSVSSLLLPERQPIWPEFWPLTPPCL